MKLRLIMAVLALVGLAGCAATPQGSAPSVGAASGAGSTVAASRAVPAVAPVEPPAPAATPTPDVALAACGTAYGLVTAFGAEPDRGHYRAALDGLPPLFAGLHGPVAVAGRALAADWAKYAPTFLAGDPLSDTEADVIVGDILDLAGSCEAAGQPAWHV